MSSPYQSIYKDSLFKNKTIIVTGGGSGIGRCTAHELASLGSTVILIGRKLEKLQIVAKEIEEDGGTADFFECDIREETIVQATVKAIIEKHPRIHGLVNNAGGQFPSPLTGINQKGWETVVRTNLTGGFLMAKMMVPETETPMENLDNIKVDEDDKPVNVIDAAAGGASSGMHLALNVGAMLLAFVALIAMLNGLLGGVGEWFGMPDITIQQILGYIFAPVAWLLGVPWSEAVTAGSFIGQKLVVNEFVAYLDFINFRDQLSEHTQVVITFALCGFANLSSIAILLGGLGGMAPSRRKDIARLGLRAVMAGSMANLMSAAIAGFFLSIS